MNTSHLPWHKVLGAVLAWCLAGPVAAAYSQIIAFGDSLSDTGNLYQLTSFLPSGGVPGEPYYAGRFSDGLLPVEVMGFELDIGVTSYAFGGAQTGAGNQGGLLLYGTGVAGQVAQFGEQLNQLSADAQALYFVWAGPNDFYTGRNMLSDNTAKSASRNQLANIQQLFELGARDFFIPLMPDLSITPAALQGDPAYRAAARERTNEYNAFLQEGLQSLSERLPGLNAFVFDTPRFMRDTIPTLAAQGFNLTDACFKAQTGEVCANQEKYAFWDTVHPSAAADWLLGSAFAKAVASPVPEPGVWLLVLGGVAVLGPRWKRSPDEAAA